MDCIINVAIFILVNLLSAKHTSMHTFKNKLFIDIKVDIHDEISNKT